MKKQFTRNRVPSLTPMRCMVCFLGEESFQTNEKTQSCTIVETQIFANTIEVEIIT